MKEREQLIESFYDILISSDAKTLDDFDKDKIKSFFMMQMLLIHILTEKDIGPTSAEYCKRRSVVHAKK